jgi:hypothetical protein
MMGKPQSEAGVDVIGKKETNRQSQIVPYALPRVLVKPPELMIVLPGHRRGFS